MKYFISGYTRILMLIILHNLIVFDLHAATAQEVTILADDSYPPYSYVENGQLKGIYIDIVTEAAKLIESSYKIRIDAVPWKRGLLALKNGSALALLPPYKHIEKRSYIWPYSVAMMKENVVAFCQKDIELSTYIKTEKIKNKAPLVVGVNAGYLIFNQKFEHAKEIKNIIVYENKSTSANIMKLYYKRLDCYVNDKHSTLWELDKLRTEKNINFDGIREALLVMTQTAHIGYTNNSLDKFIFKDDFIIRMDQALSKVISSDIYENIINRYVIIK